MKNLTISSLFLLYSIFGTAQEKQIELLGNAFLFQYNPVNKEFKLCLTQTKEEFCKKYILEEDTIENVGILVRSVNDFLNGDNKVIDSLLYVPLEKEFKELTIEKMPLIELSKIVTGTSDHPFYDKITKNISKTSSDTLYVIAKEFLNEKLKKNAMTFLKETILKQETYQFLMTQRLETKQASPSLKEYTISLLVERDKFRLQMSSKEKEKQKSFEKQIYKERFIKNFYEQFEKISETNTNTTKITDLYIQIQEKLAKEAKTEFEKEIQKSGVSIIDSILNEKKTFSGQLILNKKFDVELITKDGDKDFKKTEPDVFIVDKGTIRFFNNRIDNFSLYGSLESNPNKKMVLYNESYSYPFRELNRKVYEEEMYSFKKELYNKGTNQKRKVERIDFNYSIADAIEYFPTDRFNYSIKNQELELKPLDTVKVEERGIGDYFTGVFFSDFLGLNSSNSNNLIVAEGKIRYPIHLRSWNQHTFLDHFSGYVAISLFNGFNSNSKTLDLTKIEAKKEETQTVALNRVLNDSVQYRPETFDLLINNNVDAALNLSIFSLDWKQARTLIHLGGGIRFLRTAISYDLYNETEQQGSNNAIESVFDTTNEFQAFSFAYQANLTFELRPQSNIGADIVFGVNKLKAAGTSQNGLEFKTRYNERTNLSMRVDVFALSNSEKKSGLFFRFAGHYDTVTGRVFPQLMAGFATNLSSFVNKLKTDK